jgi:hypothetical protein
MASLSSPVLARLVETRGSGVGDQRGRARLRGLRRFSVPLLLTPRLRYHPGSRLSHARQSVLDDRGVPSLLSLRHGTEQRGQEPKAQNRFLTPLSDPESVPDPFVYGKGEKLDLDENDPLNPPYSLCPVQDRDRAGGFEIGR